MRKLSAGLLVLMLALTTLVVMPGQTDVQALGSNNIYVPVVSGGRPVTTATVTLTNVLSGEVIPAYPSSGLYLATGAPAGYYRVDVTAAGYYDSIDQREFAFYGTSTYTVSPQISLVQFGTPQYSVNVTTSPATPGVTISIYNATARETVMSGTTNSQGYVVLNMFRASAAADMYLVSEYNDKRTTATPITVTSDLTPTVTLVPANVVSGWVTNWEGTPVLDGVVAYLLSTDTSRPWITRLMKSSGLSPYFVFNSEPGTYYLCVDAPGVTADTVRQITIPGDEDQGQIQLQNQTKRTEQTDMVMASDWSSFSLAMATTLSYDETLPGLNYSDVGSLRMQIDLNLGSTDGNLDLTEVGKITNKVRRWGPAELTSGRLLVVNDTLYRNGTFGSFDFAIASGTVLGDTSGVSYGYDLTYTALGTVNPSAPSYWMNASARLDSPAAHHAYSIDLPTGYEMVYNATGSGVEVRGFTLVTIDSAIASGYYEGVHMEIQKSERPSARAAVNSLLNSAYKQVNETGALVKYFVRVGANATFNAEDSTDPNGNPLNYTWDFKDGTVVSTPNKTYVHKYLTASTERLVNLTITDVAGIQNWTEIPVVCDALDPAPKITFLNRTVNATTNTVEINQGEVLIMNATGVSPATRSSDDAATVSDGVGLIDWVEFVYGDGNTSGRMSWSEQNQNATHSYAAAGTYNLTLNVTDVVGHWKNLTVFVKVNDTTGPTVTFSVKNATGGSNLVENTTIVFDANATLDNLDNYTLLRYSWYFGDNVWLNLTGAEGGNYVTHMYTKVGTFHTALNVTDVSGNSKKTPKTINVVAGPRPNLRVDKIIYDPGNWTEDKSSWILVNITNSGSRQATGVVLTFYLVKSDGTEKLLGTSSTMYNGTELVQVVEVGGKVQVKFQYKFDNKGTYKIKVNVTCDNQLTVTKYTAPDLTVKEAGWKKPVLWGGVLAVIILVPLAIYLSRKWSKREKKGPRREKKSGEEEE
jgi:hypothetical protein